MCGRYASSKEPAVLVSEFGVTAPVKVELAADYNVAPTTSVYAVLERQQPGDNFGDRQRLLADVRWGLVPSWAKDPKVGGRLINARLETAATKPSFRAAWARRRAILPADGYYEWHTSVVDEGQLPGLASATPRKQPYFIHRRDGATLAMVGLYELWRNPEVAAEDEDAWLWTACVLTTSATDDLGFIHDRMPVTVPAGAWDAWLDPDFAGDPHDLLDPAATAGQLVAYPVSTLVNSVRNNSAHLLEPLAAGQ